VEATNLIKSMSLGRFSLRKRVLTSKLSLNRFWIKFSIGLTSYIAVVPLTRRAFDPNPDIEKRLASNRKDSEAFFGRRALVSLNRLLIHIRLDQSPVSFCNSLSLGTDYPLVLSLSSVFVSGLTRLDINSVQRISV